MTGVPTHVPADQLLLHASGELPEALRERISVHLESCAECSEQLAKLQCALADFTQAHHSAHDTSLPSSAGPRALLKAQLADLTRERSSSGQSSTEQSSSEHFLSEQSKRIFRPVGQSLMSWRGAMVFASLALVVLLVTRRDWKHIAGGRELQGAAVLAEPNANFTPGAAIAATQNQVCSSTGETPTNVPPALKTKVLQLYGIPSRQSDAYEVDYLITPELGGATDVRNLWPEPYDHTMWNAHVKDQLENRLRQMVCQGNLDLATAQHDISTDWIAAYRKYFHADAPVSHGSS